MSYEESDILVTLVNLDKSIYEGFIEDDKDCGKMSFSYCLLSKWICTLGHDV